MNYPLFFSSFYNNKRPFTKIFRR